MTRLEYELLREQEPQLLLPDYRSITDYRGTPLIERINAMDRETLIANRVAVMLGRDIPTQDYLTK